MKLLKYLRLFSLLKIISLICAFSLLVCAQDGNNHYLLNVGVTDYGRNIVKDLKKENFLLFENNKPVEISYFSNEDVPLSVGFLIDASQSMGSGINTCREVAINFIEKSNPANEYFTVAFDTKVTLVSDFSNMGDTEKIISDNQRFLEKPKPGETLIYQAMELGIENFEKAKYQKKILFIFLDAGDNYNSGKYDEIKKMIRTENITLYVIGCSKNRPSFDYKFEVFSEISGGRIIYNINSFSVYSSGEFIGNKEDFLNRFSKLAEEIRNQYTLGFTPGKDNPNKWRKLKVKVKVEKELKKKLINTFPAHREGYYPEITENSGN